MTTKSVLVDRADALFRKRVRASQRCWAFGYRHIYCSTSFECCHIHRRSYHVIRWADENAVCMCTRHHRWFTDHPNEWERYCVSKGVDYDGLRLRALYGIPERPQDAIDRLRALAREGL